VALVVSLMLIGTFVLASEMAGVSIAVASCLVLSLSMLLVRRSCYLFNLHRIGITSFWYLIYLAMIFIPAFVIYFYEVGRYRDSFLFAVESALLTVPLGWLFADWLWSFKREEIDQFYQSPVVEEVPGQTLFLRCWILLAACLALMVAYVIEVRTIPLFYLIKHPGETLELALLREESFKLLDSRLSYFYYLIRQVFFPLLITVTMGAYMHLRGKKWLFTFLLATVAGVAYAAFSIAKAPVVLIMLVAGIFYYLYKHGRPSPKAVAIVMVLMLLFPILVITYVAPSDTTTTWMVAIAIGYRLFNTPAQTVYYYFEVFPSHIPYLNIRGTDKLAKLMGVPYFDTPNFVGTYAYPRGLESISANAAFISDLHAGFGIWGVLLGGLLAGMIMQSVQIYQLRRRKTVTSLSVFAFSIVVFSFLNITSLPIVLLSDGAVIVLLIGWFLDRYRPGELMVAQV